MKTRNFQLLRWPLATVNVFPMHRVTPDITRLVISILWIYRNLIQVLLIYSLFERKSLRMSVKYKLDLYSI